MCFLAYRYVCMYVCLFVLIVVVLKFEVFVFFVFCRRFDSNVMTSFIDRSKKHYRCVYRDSPFPPMKKCAKTIQRSSSVFSYRTSKLLHWRKARIETQTSYRTVDTKQHRQTTIIINLRSKSKQ